MNVRDWFWAAMCCFVTPPQKFFGHCQVLLPSGGILFFLLWSLERLIFRYGTSYLFWYAGKKIKLLHASDKFLRKATKQSYSSSNVTKGTQLLWSFSKKRYFFCKRNRKLFCLWRRLRYPSPSRKKNVLPTQKQMLQIFAWRNWGVGHLEMLRCCYRTGTHKASQYNTWTVFIRSVRCLNIWTRRKKSRWNAVFFDQIYREKFKMHRLEKQTFGGKNTKPVFEFFPKIKINAIESIGFCRRNWK